ncbi:MAG: putative toxin-antitoxin system toxin component, PIN family [Proteobacteria bacterium]|nr:putative toxin-antitoxin system toxin component, PIN family [Pseudomonadota bacterium]
MRIVVDTNVFVSAALKDKSLPSIALHLTTQRAVLLKSVATEKQLLEVIARPYLASLIAAATSDWFKQLMAKAELVSITEKIAACRDTTDDKFLELAVNGHADFILTGDADLLVLNPFRGIPIVAPATFVQGASR